MTRYCSDCGAPIPMHERGPVSRAAQLAAADGRNIWQTNALIRHMGRRCPLTITDGLTMPVGRVDPNLLAARYAPRIFQGGNRLIDKAA